MFWYIDGTPIWATLAEGSKVNLDLWNLFIVIVSSGWTYLVIIMTLASTVFKKSSFQKNSHLRGMILKFWSWRDISVTSNTTCLKNVPNTNTFFFYTPLWQVLCNLKEPPEIYHETAIPSMHWHIKQSVHIRGLTIQTRAVSAICFHGCSMFIHQSICPVNMANFLYDLGFLGPWMYGYTTDSYNQILDRLKFWQAHSAVTTVVLKVKIFLGKLR